VRSLASEHLREIENLPDSERQKQEEIIKITLGSMFSGNVSYLADISRTWHSRGFFAAGSGTVGVSRKPRTLLTNSYDSIKTVTTITILFLALVMYPEVQKRAHAELDAVVGRDRLPTFDDRLRLPYIESICREVERWHVITPMGSIIPSVTQSGR
jgi:hypothetical protein